MYDPEDKDNGSEVIHLLMDTLPPTNIMGVYQETGKGIEEVENAHRILRNRVFPQISINSVLSLSTPHQLLLNEQHDIIHKYC